MRRLISILSVAVLLSACGDSASFLRSTPSFQSTAEANYELGLRQLKNGNYQLAQQYFQYIRNKFGFTKWATTAELALADVEMGREKYTEAIEMYRQFMRSHPNHERVQDGYVAFKVCEATSKQVPSEWFLSPPSHEKDQGPANDAYRELNDFLAQYADSPYHGQSKQLWQQVVKQLTDHELYVANFYLKLDKPKAAVWRLEGLLRDYKGANRAPEALLLLGRTYLHMKEAGQARGTFERLVAEHSKDFRAEKAKLYLAQIKKQYGDVPVPPPPAPPVDKKQKPKEPNRQEPTSTAGEGEG